MIGGQLGYGARVVDHQRVTDARTLRAFAHPVRSRLLEELNARGPMRAADLARTLGLPANQVSFHLRQLAKYDVVVEAPELARDKRDRVWRPADDDRGFRLDLDAVAQTPGGAVVAAAWRGMASERAHRAVDAAYRAERDPAVLRNITEATFQLTKAEAVELAAELDEVVMRWTARSRAAGPAGADEAGGTEGRRLYGIFHLLQPRPEEPLERGE